MKENADIKRRASPSNLKIGDIVLVRQRKDNKFSTRFDPRPFEVVRKKGTMVTAYRDGKYITRNISQFKVIDSSLKGPNREEGDEDYLNIDDTDTPLVLSVPPAPSADPIRRSNRTRNPPQRYGNFVYHGT